MIFDVDYEYSLDKKVTNSTERKTMLRKVVQKKERKIYRKDTQAVKNGKKFQP